MASKFQLEFLCLCFIQKRSRKYPWSCGTAGKSIQKLHCRVVNVIIFSSSYHVSFVSCFLSIFLNIDLANLMCMGSYMTDYIKISTNLHDGRTFFSNNENRWFMHSSINYAKAITYVWQHFFINFFHELCTLQAWIEIVFI